MSNRKANKVKEVTIAHKCTKCGRCCIDRGDISLTPLDVFNIANFLKMSTKDFIEKYCIIDELMDVRIKAVGPLNACIFLDSTTAEATKCKIYKVRPMACYLYPLKMYEGIKNAFRIDDAPYCSKSSKKIPVKEFVNAKSDGRYEDECLHIQKFAYALEMYYSYPTKSEQEMFEYFFYNDSANEAKKKVDDYLTLITT